MDGLYKYKYIYIILYLFPGIGTHLKVDMA